MIGYKYLRERVELVNWESRKLCTGIEVNLFQIWDDIFVFIVGFFFSSSDIKWSTGKNKGRVDPGTTMLVLCKLTFFYFFHSSRFIFPVPVFLYLQVSWGENTAISLPSTYFNICASKHSNSKQRYEKIGRKSDDILGYDSSEVLSISWFSVEKKIWDCREECNNMQRSRGTCHNHLISLGKFQSDLDWVFWWW